MWAEIYSSAASWKIDGFYKSLSGLSSPVVRFSPYAIAYVYALAYAYAIAYVLAYERAYVHALAYVHVFACALAYDYVYNGLSHAPALVNKCTISRRIS